MRRTTPRGLAAALAMLAIGAGQLLAPAAGAIGYPGGNGTSMNGIASMAPNGADLNGASLDGTGERDLGARQPDAAAAAPAPSRADVGRLRLHRVRLPDGR